MHDLERMVSQNVTRGPKTRMNIKQVSLHFFPLAAANSLTLAKFWSHQHQSRLAAPLAS